MAALAGLLSLLLLSWSKPGVSPSHGARRLRSSPHLSYSRNSLPPSPSARSLLQDGQPRVSPPPPEPVVKVYSVHCSVNVQMPWMSKAQEESSGSGFTIEQHGALVILTNAHVVADAAYVEVKKAGDAQKYVAEVGRISHECDLATLHVRDKEFWRGVKPFRFGSMPSLQDAVSVVGYPGEAVSPMPFAPATHSLIALLQDRLQLCRGLSFDLDPPSSLLCKIASMPALLRTASCAARLLL
eukprot:scaffold211165_cov30-Tisochrysis_lutea.AAC.1